MKRLILLMILICLDCIPGICQEGRIVFYNTENCFDTKDDPFTEDNEFLPDSSRNWTGEKYYRKLVSVSQVLSAIDGWGMPVMAGLCEIENRVVLEALVWDTPLAKYGYRIIQRDSPDPRGIDVALLYREDAFTPDSCEWLQVPLPAGSRTREILMVSGRLWGEVPVTVYVNHWPSRSGGALASDPKRMAAAAVLRASIDSVLKADPMANIIAMGDFNDEPGDRSLGSLIYGGAPMADNCQTAMVNLSEQQDMANQSGTIKYAGTWSTFDQLIVSCPVISGANGLNLVSEKAEICVEPFLLEPDPSYTGMRPKRTYIGPNYHGGFSDHLPVSIVVSHEE
jgi:hypothetical protein